MTVHRLPHPSDNNTSTTQPARTSKLGATAAEMHNRDDDWSATQQVREASACCSPSPRLQQLGIGRSLLYELLAEGQVESIHVGRLRRIPIDALADFINRQRCNAGRSADRAAQPIRKLVVRAKKLRQP
jgi:excisionase family DNA binding protein